MQATPSLRTARARVGLVRLVQELAPGGRLLRTERLRGGLGARMDRLRLEQADGARIDVSLRRFNHPGEHAGAASVIEGVQREFAILRLVERAGIPAPRPLWLDDAGDVFGVPAMALTFVPGAPWYQPRDTQTWCEDLARALHLVHAVVPLVDELSWLPLRDRQAMRDQLEGRRERVEVHIDSLVREVYAALEANLERIELAPPTFIHDDFWPGNTVWRRGRLVAVIDWSSARMGDPRTDVAQCRIDSLFSHTIELGDAFVRAYESQAERPLRDLWYFDLYVGLTALFYHERWLEGYHDAGLTHLTLEDAGGRLRTFLRRVLVERANESVVT